MKITPQKKTSLNVNPKTLEIVRKKESAMPTVKTKSGKVKHYAYTKQGEAAANLAAKQEGSKVITKKSKKKTSNRYGISNLKGK